MNRLLCALLGHRTEYRFDRGGHDFRPVRFCLRCGRPV